MRRSVRFRRSVFRRCLEECSPNPMIDGTEALTAPWRSSAMLSGSGSTGAAPDVIGRALMLDSVFLQLSGSHRTVSPAWMWAAGPM